MDSVQNLKKRLKSIGNINQITKAMELVAATKMRKSQEIALSSRPYAFAALDLLANISALEIKPPPLLQKREIKKTLYILVASDKGLAGSFNSSLFRKFENFVIENNVDLKNPDNRFAAVGEKTYNYLLKKGVKVAEKFFSVGDYTTTEEVKPLSDFLAAGYLEKRWDRVFVFSTNFRSALKQEPLFKQVLPVDFKAICRSVKEIVPEKGKFAELMKEDKIEFGSEKSKIQEYIIEPSAGEVLDSLARHLFFIQIYHIILDANASEHAARRFAMKTASDNASELSFELTLQYNKLRQSSITKEISEITSGAEFLSAQN